MEKKAWQGGKRVVRKARREFFGCIENGVEYGIKQCEGRTGSLVRFWTEGWNECRWMNEGS